MPQPPRTSAGRDMTASMVALCSRSSPIAGVMHRRSLGHNDEPNRRAQPPHSTGSEQGTTATFGRRNSGPDFMMAFLRYAFVTHRAFSGSSQISEGVGRDGASDLETARKARRLDGARGSSRQCICVSRTAQGTDDRCFARAQRNCALRPSARRFAKRTGRRFRQYQESGQTLQGGYLGDRLA